MIVATMSALRRAIARRRRSAMISLLLCAGCADPLYLGSDLIWSARHEGTDLAEWTGDPSSFLNTSDAAQARLSNDQSRRGRGALSITRPVMTAEGGPVIGHGANLPDEAYYGAWLFLPEDHDLSTYWAVAQFRSLDPADPDSFGRGADLRLRRLPDGKFVLYVFQHDDDYLQAPLTDPPPVVTFRQWFHLEIFFRHATDTTGAMRVWLDGRLVYDLSSRRTAVGLRPWFGICSESDDAGAGVLELFADDVTISRSRATPNEMLDAP